MLLKIPQDQTQSKFRHVETAYSGSHPSAHVSLKLDGSHKPRALSVPPSHSLACSLYDYLCLCTGQVVISARNLANIFPVETKTQGSIASYRNKSRTKDVAHDGTNTKIAVYDRIRYRSPQTYLCIHKMLEVNTLVREHGGYQSPDSPPTP